jgi:hypothetical protein
MKTRVLATMGLLALAVAAFTYHGIDNAGATPGSGAPTIGGIGPTPTFPLQVKAYQQTRVGLTSAAVANVPAVPLKNRNTVKVCLSQESLTLIDAGYLGNYAKFRFDNGIVGIGTPFLLDAGVAPGLELSFPGLPNQMAQVCTDEIATQSWPDAGGWVTGIANVQLIDAGAEVFVDVIEKAY